MANERYLEIDKETEYDTNRAGDTLCLDKNRGKDMIDTEQVKADQPAPDLQLAVAACPDETDEQVFYFHSISVLTPNVYESVAKNALNGYDRIDDISPVTKMLFEINGVTYVDLYPYLIKVRKARLFTWTDLAPKIVQLMLIWHNSRLETAGEPMRTMPLLIEGGQATT